MKFAGKKNQTKKTEIWREKKCPWLGNFKVKKTCRISRKKAGG